VRLLTPPIRRRLFIAVGASTVMAVLEAASFALLFFLIRALSDVNAPLPGVAKLLGASNREAFLARCGGLVLALFLLKSVGNFILLRIQSSLQANTDAYLSTALFSRYLATAYLQFIQRNSAEMIMTIQYRTADVAANSVGAVISIASETAVLVGVAVTLGIVQPVLAAGVLVFLGLVATGLLKVLTPAIRRSGYADAVEGTKAQRLLQESMGGIKAIKANELASQFVDRFILQRVKLAEIRRRRVLLTRLPQFYLENTLFIGLGLLAVVVFQIRSADVVPIFGVLVAAAFRTLPSLSRIVGSLSGVRGSEASLRYIEEDFRQPPLREASPDEPGPPVELNDQLRFRNVAFRYPTSNVDALSDITLDIAAGESIGLVGASGSGKTTFVDIVLGLLHPTHGELFVDGEPLTGERLPAWRHTIGYVPQDVFLLDATLRENIIFGRPDAGDDRLDEAVKLAQLEDVVAGLPVGLETEVGERGVRLSGGQRQRIGIARALFTRPSLLILDEATAALDTRTEAAITASVDALHGRTTTIVIAHRLSTVQHCDRLVFLDGGRIRAVDSFENLQRNDQAFSDLVRLGQLVSWREVRDESSQSR
jgi:ABC-type multidrug transport system fused ATPase/permease subunit